MKFDELLKVLEKGVNKTKVEIIAELRVYHKSFERLDKITYSRWFNGVTTPSLYKQILILKCFNKSIFDIIDVFDDIPVLKYQQEIYNGIFDSIENGYYRVRYKNNLCQDDFSKLNISMKVLASLDEDDMLERFYEQMEFYEKIKSLPIDTHVVYLKESNELRSHTAFFYNVNKVKNFLHIKSKLNSKSIFIHVGYYDSRKYHELIISLMFNCILDNYPDTETVYAAFRTSNFHSYIYVLGGEIIKVYNEEYHDDRVYLARFDWYKLVSNSLIFNFIRKNKIYYKENF